MGASVTVVLLLIWSGTVHGSGVKARNADVVFVVDASGSVSPADFRNISTFVKELYYECHHSGMHVSVIKFDGAGAQLVLGFNVSYSSDLVAEGFSNLSQNQSAQGDLGVGISFMANYVLTADAAENRSDANTMAVVIAGSASFNMASIPEALKAARAAEVMLFFLGLRADLDKLSAVATDPIKVIPVTSFSDPTDSWDIFSELPGTALNTVVLAGMVLLGVVTAAVALFHKKKPGTSNLEVRPVRRVQFDAPDPMAQESTSRATKPGVPEAPQAGNPTTQQ